METYRKFSARVCTALALAVTLFELYTVGYGILSPFAQRATLLAFASVLAFLMNPTARWPERTDLPGPARAAAALWDAVVIAAAIICCSYLILDEEGLADRSGAETRLDLIIAGIGPIVLLDMVRRVAGIPLFLVTVGVVIYAYIGDAFVIVVAAIIAVALVRWRFGWVAAALALVVFLVPLAFGDVRAFLDPETFPFRGESHDRMASYLWLTSEGTFGTIAAIMSQFIFIFILFAALLESTGAGQTLINLAFALTGRFRGGPAQAAVVASSMFGMVSGSTMANVVSTGTFTIPLMIRTGFSRHFAGAVESVASCGGQIVPPIMGASVFIMSEIIGVPYVKLMLYALIPAVLYFASLSCSIYFESARIGLERIDRSDMPDGWTEARRGGYLLIPVIVLLAGIVAGETPGLAGFKAVLALLVMVDLVRSLGWVRRRWGDPGVAAGVVLICAAFPLAIWILAPVAAAAGTVTLPVLGEVPAFRLALLAAAAACAAWPALRGLPIVFLVWLSIAQWKVPPEIVRLADVSVVGPIVLVALAALVVWLILLSVYAPRDAAPAGDGAGELAHAIVSGFEKGAKNAVSLVAATYAIGMIVGLLVLAAAGARISFLVTEVAAASLFLAFFLVMIASLVMGMGLPTIAAYLLLVIAVAPSIQELGAPLVAAHMFIFYFGVISSITPPVALAAYAASGISGASPMRTGFTACRLAITAFIVPFLFVYYPELLLLDGTLGDTAYRLAVSCLGIFFVSMAAMGYGFGALGIAARLVLTAAAAGLFLEPLWLNGAGAALGVGYLVFQRSAYAKRRGQD